MLQSDTNSCEPAALELSIVMPCLNEARTVGTCVRKALDYLDQHHVKGEVIVAHNGTDGSQAGQALVAAGYRRGGPVPGTGAKQRVRWISTTSRPMHSPRWALRRTISRSPPICPLGIIPGGPAPLSSIASCRPIPGCARRPRCRPQARHRDPPLRCLRGNRPR
jgi:hypothetical protein